MNNYISCFWSQYLVGSTYVGVCSKFQINWMKNDWDIVDYSQSHFGHLINNWITLAGSRGSFDPKKTGNANGINKIEMNH